jgi:hypothetical protein
MISDTLNKRTMLNHNDIYAHMEEPYPQVLSVTPMNDHDLHTWVVVIRIPKGMLQSMLRHNSASTYTRLKDALLHMFISCCRKSNPLQLLAKKRA